MWAPKFAFDQDERHDDGDETAVPQPVTAIIMLRGALVVGAVALLVFTFIPGIDLSVSQLFYAGKRQFIGNEALLFPMMRMAFNVFFYSACIIAAVGLFLSARRCGPCLDLDVRKWIFIALCLITGPLVVANIGFKDHWGRARPRDVIEFDGSKAFSAPFPPSTQCDYNCSFVSGEASSIFIVLFTLALLFKSRSRNFVLLGIVLGGLSGLTRIAQGGHFLSDVVFAGVLMAVTAASIHLLFDFLEREQARPTEQASA